MAVRTPYQLTIDDVLADAHTNTETQSERDELMTAEELAERLRMTRAWVYAETRLGRIPHLRLGRYFRYRRCTIEAWIGELEARRGTGVGAERSYRTAQEGPPERG